MLTSELEVVLVEATKRPRGHETSSPEGGEAHRDKRHSSSAVTDEALTTGDIGGSSDFISGDMNGNKKKVISERAKQLVQDTFGSKFENFPECIRYQYNEKELELAIDAKFLPCKLSSRAHKDDFHNTLVVTVDGYGRWKCSHPHCDDILDCKRVKFLSTAKHISIVFPRKSNLTTPDDEDEVSEDALIKALENMNDRFAVVMYGSGVYVVDFHAKNSETDEREISFLREKDFFTFVANITVWTMHHRGDRKVILSVGKEWMRWKKRRTYDRIVFDPSTKTHANNVYNFWNGLSCKPNPAGGDIGPMIQARRELLSGGDETVLDYLLDLEARMVQKPDEALGIGLVFLRSRESQESIIFAEQMGSYFGTHCKSLLHPSELTNNFNRWVCDTLVILVDPSRWVSSNKESCEILLRSLYTGSNDMFREQKGKELCPAINRFKTIVASRDSSYAVRTDLNDQWLAAFRFSDDARFDADYFDTIRSQWELPGVKEGYLHFLMARDIREFRPKNRPVRCVSNLWSQKKEHMDSLHAFWYHVLCVGAKGIVPRFHDTNKWPRRIRTREVYDSYREFIRSIPGRYPAKSIVANSDQMWKQLKERVLPSPFDYAMKKACVGKVQMNKYVVPCFKCCREYFSLRVVFTPFETLFDETDSEEIKQNDDKAKCFCSVLLQ